MWAIEQYAGAKPDMTVFGKSIASLLPLAGVTGGAEVMDAVPPGGLGSTFGGNPLSCAAALAVLDVVTEDGFLAGTASLAAHSAPGSRTSPRDIRRSARFAGWVRCSRSSSPSGRQIVPKAVVDAAFERGLVLLSCGLYGNVNSAALTPTQHRAGRVGRGARHPGGVAWRLRRAPRTSASET